MKAFSFMIVLQLAAALPALAGTELVVTRGSGHVDFEAVGHPSALRIKGSTDSLEGKLVSTPTGLGGKLTVELDTLDTGIKTRNEHMTRRYLETGKFPKGELEVTKVGSLKEGVKLAPGSFDFEGRFTLHGVTKPVSGHAELTQLAGGKVRFEAAFDVSIKDYGITTPSFAGITVTDTVKVSVKAEARLPEGAAAL